MNKTTNTIGNIKDSEYLRVINKIISWIENKQFTSYDPYDILGHSIITRIRRKSWDPITIASSKTDEHSYFSKMIKKSLMPFYQSKSFTNLLRILFGIKKNINPKTFGLITQGYCDLFRLTKEHQFLEKIETALEWLIIHSNKDFGKYCWGIPYTWQMVRPNYLIPKGAPQSTLTAVNALSFLDAFHLTQNEKYLDVSKSCAKFMLEDLRIRKIKTNEISFSYTPYDDTHVLNVNLHIGALFSRLWKITNEDIYHDYCVKGMNFVMSHQREDGAWYYSSDIDGYVNAVDNTHTGDNLEYLQIISENLDDFMYRDKFNLGIEYYANNFFLETGMPKYTDKSIYPVDIHTCSQSVITLSLLAKNNSVYLDLAKKVNDWIIRNMFDHRGYFYYRLYQKNNYDKNDFIGWGDAWMIKALACLLKAEYIT